MALHRALLLLLAAPLLACQPTTTGDDGGLPDGGTDGGAADAGADAGALDAGGGDDGGASDAGPGCVGACAVTDLVATFGSATASFNRAQHGVERDGGLYVEAHFGGDPACPGPTSPTPDRTLIIAGLRSAGDGGAQTEADGVRVTLFDFLGSLSSRPLVRAVSARAVLRHAEPGTLVSFTIEAAFDGGVVTGGVAASHCASLDGP